MMRAIAVCAIGLEKVLAKDLAHLGFKDMGRSAGRVSFNVSMDSLGEDLAKANIGLRTADRVMLVLSEFKAIDFDGFYRGIASIPWTQYCTRDTRVLIERARARQCKLHAQATLQSMTQKAIYADLMQQFRVNKMPETGDTLEVRVYGDNDWWQIVIDTSGEALSRRGYRRFTHEAPLKETIAASMLFLAGWSRARPLVDPFCGSGTIPIEAALYACNQAPGLNRHFAFERFPGMDGNKIEDIRLFFKQQSRKDIRTDIQASDLDERALDLGRNNAKLASIGEFIHFSKADARELVPSGANGVLLGNPPYGQRLADPEEVRDLYRGIGPMLGRFLDAGWECGFLSADKEFGSIVGFKPASVREIVSGQETIYFNWFSGKREEHGRAGADSDKV